ncbi:MAG: PPC domain-containing DNA-binding protein [Methanotrichaceae archaeon]
MQYSEGSLGRVFVLRLDDGEDLISSVQRFVEEKKIVSCMALFIGALRDGRMVTGPEAPVIPPIPHFENFNSAWEVFGMATIYPSQEGSRIHIHSSLGRGREALTGCIREKATAYLIVEIVLFEFSGLSAKREFDEITGLHLLSLKSRL